MRPEISNAKRPLVHTEEISSPPMLIWTERCRLTVGDEAAQVSISAPEHPRKSGIALWTAINRGGQCRARVGIALVDQCLRFLHGPPMLPL